MKQTLEEIAKSLNRSREDVKEMLEFLDEQFPEALVRPAPPTDQQRQYGKERG